MSFSDHALERVRDVTATFADSVIRFFDLPPEYEFHGVRLERTGKRPEDPDYLKPHARDFLYRHALEHVAGLPTVRIHSVFWDWSPAPRKVPGQGPASRDYALYERLFDWLGEEGEPVTSLTVDGLNNQTALRAFRRYRRHKAEALIPEPVLVDSGTERLIQVSDLVAYASYQVAVNHPEETDRQKKFRVWHNETIRGVAAEGHWRHAMRCYAGEKAPDRLD